MPFAPPTVILSNGKAALSPTGLRRIVLVQEHSVIDRATGDLSPGLALPARIELESLADDRLRVKEGIEVVIFETEGFILAEAVGFNEFGQGDNPAAAVAELQYALADLYFSLAGDQHRLGQWLQEVWAGLQTKMEPV